jgi:hypothetical protein
MSGFKWGLPGKQITVHTKAPGKKLPLNNNPTDAWDSRNSNYIWVELQPIMIGKGSIETTPSPSPSFTPTSTPTSTPTPTPSPTPPPQYYILYENGDIMEAENNDLIEYQH